MNKEDVIRNWITDLRSGKYQQHRGSMHNQDKDAFCCLGVLAYKTMGMSIDEDLRFEDDWGTYDNIINLLNEKSLHGDYRFNNTPISMNDGTGLYENNPQSFEQIADWLEAIVLQEGYMS